MVRLILHKAIFAASQTRWCTDELKRKVARGYLDTCDDPVNALGLRQGSAAAGSVSQFRGFKRGIVAKTGTDA